jgi:hypothetical protein
LLGRLLPLQVNARTQAHVRIQYSTVEQMREALIAKGLAPERADLLLFGAVPQPITINNDTGEKE